MTLYPHRLEFAVLPIVLRSPVPGVAAAVPNPTHDNAPLHLNGAFVYLPEGGHRCSKVNPPPMSRY